MDGMKNGKGKEYLDGKLRFDGEFVDDYRNGKGKEYDDNGKIIFQGKYKNGEKNFKNKCIKVEINIF